MAMSYIEQELDKAGRKDLAKIMAGLREAYGGDISLPEVSTSRSSQRTSVDTEVASKIDLRKQTYDLLTHVIEPSDAEKEALRVKRGLVFLPMTSQSYAQVVAEDPNHFWDTELKYANARPELRDYTPPIAVEVGLNVAELALPDSFDKPRAVALQMIEDYSQELEAEFPGFKAIMLPVTGYARVDRAYAERNTDQVLFKNYFAWGLDNISEVFAADAGRLDPGYQFRVVGWLAGCGRPDVGAVPAVVKLVINN